MQKNINLLFALIIFSLICYYAITNIDWSEFELKKGTPMNFKQIFDFEGAKQKGIERQKAIDNFSY